MKAREIYESALSLLAEQNTDGADYDTDAFEASAPALINLLCVLLDELDLHIKNRKFRDDQSEIRRIETLEDEVPLHPILQRGVMPLGLAFLLIAEENATRANLFFNLYQKEKEALFRRWKRGRRHSITSVY